LITQFGGTVGGFHCSLLEELGGWDENMLAEDKGRQPTPRGLSCESLMLTLHNQNTKAPFEVRAETTA